MSKKQHIIFEKDGNGNSLVTCSEIPVKYINEAKEIFEKSSLSEMAYVVENGKVREFKINF